MHSSVLITVDILVFQKDFERFQLSDILQHYCKCYWKVNTGFLHIIEIYSKDETPVLQKLASLTLLHISNTVRFIKINSEFDESMG